MISIQIFDTIAASALEQLDRATYHIGYEVENPHVILVRSHSLHDHSFGDRLQAVGRAGVGTDTIPVEWLTTLGIPVFYAPGANANAVKELVLAAMLIGYRHLDEARSFLTHIKKHNKQSLSKTIELQKKKFVGHEISGKTLGVIGLGHIGVKVANAAHALGMRVLGYDPHMTLRNALALTPEVEHVMDMNAVLSHSDIITLHIPLTANTTSLINENNASYIKPHALLLNFSREQIVSEKAIIHQLQSQNLLGYITDFPTPDLASHPQVLSFPHLGASTAEAEVNSAQMVIRTITTYLESGTIEHSINYPDIYLPLHHRSDGCRLVIINHNKPGVIADCTEIVSQGGYNIEGMVNASKADIAVNLIDISGVKGDITSLLHTLETIDSIIRVRTINS